MCTILLNQRKTYYLLWSSNVWGFPTLRWPQSDPLGSLMPQRLPSNFWRVIFKFDAVSLLVTWIGLRQIRPVGRNFQRGVRRHASQVAHLATGGLGALSDPQKPRGIWSKILQSSNFKALHSNFRKVPFFKIQILHQLGLWSVTKCRL